MLNVEKEKNVSQILLVSTKDYYHESAFWSLLLKMLSVNALLEWIVYNLLLKLHWKFIILEIMVCRTENSGAKLLFFWLCIYECLKYTLASSWVLCTFTDFGDNFSLLEISVFLMRPDVLSKWLYKCMWICGYPHAF